MARLNDSDSQNRARFAQGKGRRYAFRLAVKLDNGKMQLLNNASLGFDPDDKKDSRCNEVQGAVIDFLVSLIEEQEEPTWTPFKLGGKTFYISLARTKANQEKEKITHSWGD